MTTSFSVLQSDQATSKISSAAKSGEQKTSLGVSDFGDMLLADASKLPVNGPGSLEHVSFEELHSQDLAEPVEAIETMLEDEDGETQFPILLARSSAKPLMQEEADKPVEAEKYTLEVPALPMNGDAGEVSLEKSELDARLAKGEGLEQEQQDLLGEVRHSTTSSLDQQGTWRPRNYMAEEEPINPLQGRLTQDAALNLPTVPVGKPTVADTNEPLDPLVQLRHGEDSHVTQSAPTTITASDVAQLSQSTMALAPRPFAQTSNDAKAIVAVNLQETHRTSRTKARLDESSYAGLQDKQTATLAINTAAPLQTVSQLQPMSRPFSVQAAFGRYEELQGNGLEAKLDGRTEHGIFERSSAASIAAQQFVARPDIPRNLAMQMTQGVKGHTNGVVEITLQPEELGRIKMTISTLETGIAISVLAERSETFEMMRRYATALTKELESLGFDTVDLSFAQTEQNGTDRERPEEPQGKSTSDKPEAGAKLGISLEIVDATDLDRTKALDKRI